MVTNMETRQSMLDSVKNGLLTSRRTTYLHRMLYVGEHGLGRGGLEEVMKNIVSAQADQPREEALTGFLLVYHAHFIHLVEGSESTLTRHLRRVADPRLDEAPQLKRVKVIFEATHINKRCVSGWTCRSATPPTLAAAPKDGAVVVETAHQVDAVLNKTLRLLDAMKKLPPGAPLSAAVSLQLPEAELLQALLASPLIRDLRTLLEEQRVPPRVTLYEDVVWPMPSDFVPYNLLEQPPELHRGRKADGEDGEKSDEAGQPSPLPSPREDSSGGEAQYRNEEEEKDGEEREDQSR